MSKPSGMQLASLGPFVLRARDCVAAMLTNGKFILQELPSVPMDELLRRRARMACACLLGARHDLIAGLFELDDRAASGASDAEIVQRVRRLVGWAREDVTPIAELARRLDRSGGHTDDLELASILLMESAGNIVIAFNAMQAAANDLLRDASAPGCDDTFKDLWLTGPAL